MPAQPLEVLLVQVLEVEQQRGVGQHPRVQLVDQPPQSPGVLDPPVQRRLGRLPLSAASVGGERRLEVLLDREAGRAGQPFEPFKINW